MEKKVKQHHTPIRNKARRITLLVICVYAGILGMIHGFFEIQNDNTHTNGLMINAIGYPCKANEVWHGCFPAITIVSNFLITGILAITFSLILIICSILFIHKKYGSFIFIGLGILMLIVGAGFVSTFLTLIAGIFAFNLNSELTFWKILMPNTINKILSSLWIWILTIFVVWSSTEWIFGYFFNQILVNIGSFLFIINTFILPLLLIFSAFAKDSIWEQNI